MGIVTVSGLPGSGTSTVSRLVVQHTGWDYTNAGEIFRQLATEAGVSLMEYGRRAEHDAQIDRDLDARMVEVARAGAAGLVLEGRLTGWMAHRHGVPALKVWLDADLRARASRVSGRDGLFLDDAIEAMVARERSEAKRYVEHHGIDIADKSIYDLVIDTCSSAPPGIAEVICSRQMRMERK